MNAHEELIEQGYKLETYSNEKGSLIYIYKKAFLALIFANKNGLVGFTFANDEDDNLFFFEEELLDLMLRWMKEYKGGIIDV